MSEADLNRIDTRLSLHAVAELLVAGPQHAASNTVRLRVCPGGFGTTKQPEVYVEAGDLVLGAPQESSHGHGHRDGHGHGQGAASGPDTRRRVTLNGRTVAEAGAALGLRPVSLNDVYSGGPNLGPDHLLRIDPPAAAEMAEAFLMGDAVLASFAPAEQRVVWPEHFDLGVSVAEVNYGVSAGDDYLPEPYAYIGPWDREAYDGPFWNAPFGAAITIREVGGATGLAAFFVNGRRLTQAG